MENYLQDQTTKTFKKSYTSEDITKVETYPIQGSEERGIDRDTDERFGVRTNFDSLSGEERYRYYPMYRDGRHVGYKRRDMRTKEFSAVGNCTKSDLFGKHLLGRGGKMLVVLEGEEDVLAAYQMFKQCGKTYRVVGLPMGTHSARHELEYLEQYESVVLCLDSDREGKAAAQEIASLLSPGKARVMTLPQGYKDANDMLIAGLHKEFLQALNDSSEYSPGGIITGEAVWQGMKSYVKPKSIPYPPEWADLNSKLEGMREGEISLWTAGTGIAKTTFIRRIKQHILKTTNWRIGEIELEEGKEKTWRGLMQFELQKPWSVATEKERHEAYLTTYGTERIHTVDHRGGVRGDSLLPKLRYLVYGLRCDIIFLDHLSLAVSEFKGEGLEAQDRMMEDFANFVAETGVHLCLVSHLRKGPSGGKGFEQGAVPTDDDLRGSGSVKQLSFDIIAVSRDKSAEDEKVRNTSRLHVLKCRETGNTGPADWLYYDRDTLSLVPADGPEEDGYDDGGTF